MDNPIAFVIDKTEELIGHSPHPAIVAEPLGAWTASNIRDGLAMATGEESFDDAARISMAVGLMGAAGAVVTGLRDYSKIPKDWPSHAVATSHELYNAVASSLIAAGYIMRVRDHSAGRLTSFGARLLGLSGSGISLCSAWLGGKLVEEMGEGVKPVMDRMSAEEHHGRTRLDPHAPLGVEHAVFREIWLKEGKRTRRPVLSGAEVIVEPGGDVGDDLGPAGRVQRFVLEAGIDLDRPVDRAEMLEKPEACPVVDDRVGTSQDHQHW